MLDFMIIKPYNNLKSLVILKKNVKIALLMELAHLANIPLINYLMENVYVVL